MVFGNGSETKRPVIRRSYNIKRSSYMRKQQYETSARIAMVALIGIVLSLTIMIAIGKHEPVQEAMAQEPILWIPTPLEQARMDSLYSIDAATKADMDSIMDMIDAILIKLD